jgi:hypothetical protein
LPRWLGFLSNWYGISPEKGAETSLYLATSPDAASATGKYFRKCKETPCNPIAEDGEIASRLWRISEELTGWR